MDLRDELRGGDWEGKRTPEWTLGVGSTTSSRACTVRFSEAANGQIEKRAIFMFFQKVKKIDFYKSQKLIDLSNAERSWGPI